jgi:hypothetical protein
VVTPISEIDARRIDEDWPWVRENRVLVERHWDNLTRANPALYNGRVLVRRAQSLIGRRLTLRYVETDYASFITFRDHGFPDMTAGNGFAMAALKSEDGAYLLGRMAGHTANAGKIYFPAGTPEPKDVLSDGTVDLAGSVLRELIEETGLTEWDVELTDRWVATFAGARTAMMREVRVPGAAEAARERILAHLARERRPELLDIHIVRQPDDIDPAAMPPFMQAYLRFALAGGGRP